MKDSTKSGCEWMESTDPPIKHRRVYILLAVLFSVISLSLIVFFQGTLLSGVGIIMGSLIGYFLRKGRILVLFEEKPHEVDLTSYRQLEKNHY